MYSLFCFMKQLIYRKTCGSIKCRLSENSAASTRLLLLGCCSDEQHVITPDENLAEFAGHLSVDEFLCVGELEVHVGVCGDEESGVFHAPLESDGHLFPGEFGEEWFGVDWDKLWWGVEDVVVRRASVLFCSGGFERIVRKLRLFGEDWFIGGSTCL